MITEMITEMTTDEELMAIFMPLGGTAALELAWQIRRRWADSSAGIG